MGRHNRVCRTYVIPHQVEDTGSGHVWGASEASPTRRERLSNDSKSDKQAERPIQTALSFGYFDASQQEEIRGPKESWEQFEHRLSPWIKRICRRWRAS